MSMGREVCGAASTSKRDLEFVVAYLLFNFFFYVYPISRRDLRVGDLNLDLDLGAATSTSAFKSERLE